MAFRVKYKTVTGLDGGVFVIVGVSKDQILKVSRQGIQKDYNNVLPYGSFTGNEYAFNHARKAITFGTNYPFLGDEDIHIIYKEAL